MDGSNSNQEVGQFAGDTPLTGHNIQGHSLNVMLVRDMPAEVLRTSVTHFGTRGLYGKAVRRTSQHDQDNVRRKKWRDSQSSKPKVKPKPNSPSEDDEGQDHQEGSEHSAGVPPSVLSAPGPANKPGEKILDLSPPFQPPSPTVAIPPSSKKTSIRRAQTLPTISPSVYERTPRYAHSQTLSGASKSCNAPPKSVEREEHASPLRHHVGEPGVARPAYSSPAGITAHPAIEPFSRCDAPASRGRMSHETRHGWPPTSRDPTAIDAPIPTEPIDSRDSVDASTSASAFIQQVAEMRVSTAVEQTFGAVEFANANVDARHSAPHPMQHRLHHEKTLYRRREASSSAPRSGRPLARSASDGSWSNQAQASTPSRFNAPGEIHPAWYGYPATTEVYANRSSITNVAARSSIAPSPGLNTYPVQNYVPPVNEYTPPMWGSTRVPEGEGWMITPPPNAYPAYSASPSPAGAFNQYSQGNTTPTRATTMPSDEHIRALVDRYTRPPSGPYAEDAIASSGPVNTSTGELEAVWPMVPEPQLANGANSNLDPCYGGALSVGASSTANAYPPGAVPTGSETYYTHNFVGNVGASSPLWTQQARPMDPMCDDHNASLGRGLQQEHDTHAIASWTHFPGPEPGYPVHGADNRPMSSQVAVTSDKVYNAPHQNFPRPVGQVSSSHMPVRPRPESRIHKSTYSPAEPP